MTGYPGDEHVFCVVGIVLARSPDCNPSNSGYSCVLAAKSCVRVRLVTVSRLL